MMLEKEIYLVLTLLNALKYETNLFFSLVVNCKPVCFYVTC